MAVNKKAGELKVFKIHYFVGDYFSSKGEQEKIATIAAHSKMKWRDNSTLYSVDAV